MVKFLRKERIKYFFILFTLSIFLVIFASGDKSSTIDLISVLTSANYVCLILNNIYIYYIFVRENKVKSVYDKIVVRIGKRNFYKSFIINFIFDILIYFALVIIPIYIKHGININFINILIVYVVLNFINFIIMEFISMLIFLIPKGNKFISIPVFMNFGFHYFLIPLVVNGIFKM